MRRALRLVAATAVVVCSVVAVPGHDWAAADETSAAVTNVADCLHERGHLLVEMLIDQSESLKGTDPSNERVGAIKIALAGLSRLAARRDVRGKAPVIEAKLSGFDVGYEKVADWTALSNATIPNLTGAADAYAGRNLGFDTDYAAAFLGAQQSLAQRSAQLTKSGAELPCTALVWFTDGRYEIEVRDNDTTRERYGTTKGYAPQFDLSRSEGAAQATEFGRELLCRPDGLVDQLRTGGTTILAFLLATQVQPADADYLRAIATGRGGASTCGVPGSGAPGAFFTTPEAWKIPLIIDGPVVKARDGTPQGGEVETRLCPKTACAEGVRRFTIDPGLRSFHLLAVTGSKQIVVEVKPPGASKPVAFSAPDSRTAAVGKTKLTSQWPAGNAVVVDANRGGTDKNWVGQWEVTFIDPTGTNKGAVARSQIHIFGDLKPVLAQAPKFILGQTGTVPVSVVHSDGTPATELRNFKQARVKAEVIEPGKRGVRNEIAMKRRGNEFEGTYKVDRGIRASRVNVTLELNLVTKSGIALAPVVRTFPVDIHPPEGYPTLSPTKPRFGSITGAKSSTAKIEVTGGTAAGCVWFEPVQIENLPHGVRSAALTSTPNATSEQSCMRVNAGEHRTVELTIQPDGKADGSLLGHVTARLKVDGNDRRIPQDLPVTVAMELPIDTGTRLMYFSALLIPGLLLPFLVVWLLKWIAAHFESIDNMRMVKLAVAVEGSQVKFADGSAFTLANVSIPHVELTGTRRNPVLGELHLESRVGLNPFTPPYGVVRNATTPVLHHYYDRDGDHLPLSLCDTWLCVVTDVSHVDDNLVINGALYILIVDDGAATTRIREIEASVRGELPGLAEIAAARFPQDKLPDTEKEPAMVGSGLQDASDPSQPPPPPGFGDTTPPPPAPGVPGDPFDKPPPSPF